MTRFAAIDIDPDTTSGTELADDILDPLQQAIYTSHFGVGAPNSAYAGSGLIYVDDQTTYWKVMFRDASDTPVVDVELFRYTLATEKASLGAAVLLDAAVSAISNITTAMFATNVVDTDITFAANSNTRIPSQAAAKSYVDSALQGLRWKAPARVATTANITLSGAQTIDGVSIIAGDRVLVKDQTTGSQNGIYLCAAGAWTRTTDADSAAELINATLLVSEGTTYSDFQFTCTNNTITLGTTSIVFVAITGGTSYTAGTGLQLVGSQFSISDAELLAIAGLTSGANKLPYFTGSGTAALADFSAYGRSIAAVADEAAFKALVNLEAGTDFNAYDAKIAAFAGLTGAANKVAYFTGASAMAVTDFSAYGRSIVGVADEATLKALINLEIGVDVQAYDSDLTAFAGKTAPSGAVVGTSDSQTLTNKTFDAASNTVSNLATTMFAANAVDNDGTLAANSSTRLPTQAAVKTYADSLANGLRWKAPARAATTANITLSGAQTIDGVSVIAADRVLVKNQTTGAENGIYVCAAGAWARSADADSAAELISATVMVSEGTVNQDMQYTCTNNSITLGTTSIVFVAIAGGNTYSAGTGLSLSGNQFAINDAELLALLGLTSAADKVPYFTGSGTAALADFSSYGRSIVAVANEAALKALINAEAGVDFQAYNTNLASLAGLTLAADKVLYATGAATIAQATFTSYGRSVVAVADEAALKALINLEIGVDVQAYDADLTAFAAKTAPSGAVVGTTDTQTLTNKTFDAASNTLSNITTSMFATNVVDNDAALAAASSSRLPTQSAVKNYVDNSILGLKWKPAVRVATTANITLSGTQTIDGVAVIATERVLVKNQTTGSENGIYVCAAGAWSRATDADTGAELVSATVMVSEGTANADTQWTCTNNSITLGSTSVVFAMISAATYTAGAGLQLVGSQFSVSDVELLAIAGLTSAADRVPYFTGSGTAALATFTSYGRSIVAVADEATLKALINLEAGTDFNAYDAKIAAFAGLTGAADKVAYFTGASAMATATFTSYGRSIVAVADEAALKALINAEAGVDFQAYDADLAAIAGLTSAANKLPYFTGAGTAALADLSSAGRDLIDDADPAAQRVTLGFTTGTVLKRSIGTYASNADLAGSVAIIPSDDTLPQKTEGIQIISVNHTPLSATNILRITFMGEAAADIAGRTMAAALFKDTENDARAVGAAAEPVADYLTTIAFKYEFVGGTTSQITFAVRAGQNNAGGNMRFNGTTSVRRFGGAMQAVLLIEEIVP